MTKRTDEVESVGLPTFSKWLIAVVALFTVAWLAGAVLLGLHPESIAKAPEKLNEWGDFAAGVSAPIAFIWLVLAVVLQSTELKEQRKELTLTRREFEYNREVMRAQADEARRQAEFIERQTRIISENHEMAAANELFKTNVDLVNTRLRQYVHAWDIGVVNADGSVDAMTTSPFRIAPEFYNNQAEELHIPHTVKTQRTKLRWYRENYPDATLAPQHPLDFERLRSAVVSATDAINALPPQFQVRAKTLELDTLKSQVEFLASKMPKPSFFSRLKDD